MSNYVRIIKIPFKRGNTAQNDAYTGNPSEITIDTEKMTLRVHDGVTPGGNELMRQNELAALVSAASLLTKLLTVDGAGSGLDADKLDGYHASYFGSQSDVTTLQSDVNLRLRIDTGTQNLTGQQKANGRVNLGLTALASTAAWGDLVNVPSLVNTFNTRSGAITLLSADVTTALGYTPFHAGNLTNVSQLINNVGYITNTNAALTNTPTAPTAAPGTNNNQIATTAYADASAAAAAAAVVASSPEALNTLSEFAAALGNDANFATTISTALGSRLRVDTNAQGLTGEQKLNALTNLGIQTTDGLTEGVSKLFFTQERARSAITVTGAGATYNPATGALDITGAVSSINGETGDVTLTYSDITGTIEGIAIGGTTRAAGSFTSLSAITSGLNATLSIEDTGENGVGLKLTGNGAVTPNKYIRVKDGKFEVMNSDYSSAIFSLTDVGVVSASSFIGSQGLKEGTGDDGISRVSFPRGASYSGGSAVTGAIKIKLPVALSTFDNAIRLRVEMYEHTVGESVTLLIGGYVTPAMVWDSETVSILSPVGDRDHKVRFGSDASGPCIWIGELAGVWNFPRVYVSEAMVSHNNDGGSVDRIASGWTITLVTAFDTVGDTISGNLVYAKNVTGIVSIANGGTGAATAAAALTALSGVAYTTLTGSAKLPSGLTSERDASPQEGYIRFNKTLKQYEGYNGTAWAPIGAGAAGAPGNQVFFENDSVVTGPYTITAGKNVMAAGPLLFEDAAVVTIPDGSVLTIVGA